MRLMIGGGKRNGNGNGNGSGSGNQAPTTNPLPQVSTRARRCHRAGLLALYMPGGRSDPQMQAPILRIFSYLTSTYI